MKKLFAALTLMTIVLLVGLCAVACAADAAPATQTAAQTLADTLQQTIFPVIASFVLGLVSLTATKIGQKFKIDALTQKNNFLVQVAAQGVAYAEEKAAALIGSKAQLTGSDKLDEAIGYICKALPKVTPDEAQRAATAALAMIPGVGATGAAAVALASGQAAPASVAVSTVAGSLTPATETAAV